jgi:hypothetical protein
MAKDRNLSQSLFPFYGNRQRAPTLYCTGAFIAILAVAAGLRLINLGSATITRDEAFSWRVIQYPTKELIERTSDDVHPPLYYLVLKCWASRTSDDILLLRLLLATAGIASVVVAYFVVECASHEESEGRIWASFVAMSAMAIHIDQVSHSRAARMYSLGVFLSLIAILSVLKLANGSKHQKKWRIVFAASLIAMCLVHNHLLVVAACLLGAAYTITPANRSSMVAIAVIVALVYSAWLPSLWTQLRMVRAGYWLAATSPNDFANLFSSWVFGVGGSYSTLEQLFGIALSVVVLGVTTKACGKRLLPLLSCVIGLVAFCVVASLTVSNSIFAPRYLIFGHAAFLCLVGAFTARIPQRWARALFTAIVLGIMGWNSASKISSLRCNEDSSIAAAIATLAASNEGLAAPLIVSTFPALNRVKYYVTRDSRLADLRVAAELKRSSSNGHIVHIASMERSELVSEVYSAFRNDNYWWYFDDDDPDVKPPDSFDVVARHAFTSPSGQTCHLLYCSKRDADSNSVLMKGRFTK